MCTHLQTDYRLTSMLHGCRMRSNVCLILLVCHLYFRYSILFTSTFLNHSLDTMVLFVWLAEGTSSLEWHDVGSVSWCKFTIIRASVFFWCPYQDSIVLCVFSIGADLHFLVHYFPSTIISNKFYFQLVPASFFSGWGDHQQCVARSMQQHKCMTSSALFSFYFCSPKFPPPSHFFTWPFHWFSCIFLHGDLICKLYNSFQYSCGLLLLRLDRMILIMKGSKI